MLRSRIIPCLLLHNKGLVKTIEFSNPKYVGDPINVVKIFNEKEVDELILLDIDASIEGRPPNFNLIKNIANECRMPLCYGGGITSVEEAKKIINIGVEKVALSTSAIKNPSLLSEIGSAVGIQSVVVVIDVKKTKNIFKKDDYEIYLKNGKYNTKLNLQDYINILNTIGIGEIVINSIDLDGKMSGYDFELVEIVRNLTNVPITVLGGASDISNIEELIKKYKIIGAAAGSLFVFKGKYRAVLINYPDTSSKNKLTNYF